MITREAEWCKAWIMAQASGHPFLNLETLDRHPPCACEHCRARRFLFPLLDEKGCDVCGWVKEDCVCLPAPLGDDGSGFYDPTKPAPPAPDVPEIDFGKVSPPAPTDEEKERRDAVNTINELVETEGDYSERRAWGDIRYLLSLSAKSVSVTRDQVKDLAVLVQGINAERSPWVIEGWLNREIGVNVVEGEEKK